MKVVVPPLSEWEAQQARRHLLDFIPHTSKKYQAPTHLAPLLNRFERALNGEPQFVVCHAPPRHGKTEALMHFVGWGLMKRPDLVFSYTTYGASLANRKVRKMRSIFKRVGVRFVSDSLADMRTEEQGGLIAGGIKGPLVGEGINIALIDDPVKNMAEAYSALDRANKEDWFESALDTRIEPGGSVFLFMQRWHPDDLAAYLIKTHKFEYLRFPAINAKGEALWPQRWPAGCQRFERAKRLKHVWEALYQGEPKPRGQAVFDDCHTYSALPKVFQSGWGVDLSYSAKTRSDWSIAIRLLKAIHTDGKPIFYVANVVRRQVRVPVFRHLCAQLHLKDQGAVGWRWYTSTTEQGVADLFASGEEDYVPLTPILAQGDKLIRAGPVAEAWNAGRVLVPENAAWLNDFLAVVTGFTGVNDAHDDDVDALAAAFDELNDGDAGERDFDEPPAAEDVRMGVGAKSL